MVAEAREAERAGERGMEAAKLRARLAGEE